MDKRKKTILFVDDDEYFLHDIAELMENSGFRVLTKSNGAAALSLLEEGVAVNAVVVDYLMPGMSGLEFMTEYRNRKYTVPIIFLTANGDVETYIRAMNLGVYEFMNKPISMGALQAIVEAALN